MVQVIDASVAIKWLVKEEGQETSLQIFKEALDSPQKFAVPELFYFELLHVFHRLVPKPNRGQQATLDQILNLGLYRFSMTPELGHEIFHFQEKGLSGYDSAYLALAKILKGIWLTFDKKAHKKVVHFHLSKLLE